MTLSIGATARSAALSMLGAILAMALAIARTAGADEIRVLSSGAPAEIVKHIAAKFAGERGHRVLVTVANPATILQKLSGGETPDIVGAPAPVVESLAKSGTLLPGSRVDLARVGVGVVVREGTPLRTYRASTRCEKRSPRPARSSIPIPPAAGRPERRLRA